MGVDPRLIESVRTFIPPDGDLFQYSSILGWKLLVLEHFNKKLQNVCVVFKCSIATFFENQYQPIFVWTFDDNIPVPKPVRRSFFDRNRNRFWNFYFLWSWTGIRTDISWGFLSLAHVFDILLDITITITVLRMNQLICSKKKKRCHRFVCWCRVWFWSFFSRLFHENPS